MSQASAPSISYLGQSVDNHLPPTALQNAALIHFVERFFRLPLAFCLGFAKSIAHNFSHAFF